MVDVADSNTEISISHASVTESVSAAGVLWTTYVGISLYLLIAAGIVNHEDLFFENSVKLPFLGVEVPLLAFFWASPIFFVVLHLYTLLHVVFLTDKIRDFNERLSISGLPERPQIMERQKLPINIFVQLLAGPPEVGTWPINYLLYFITAFSLVFAPVFLLTFFQLQFLPYHDEAITWLQRVAVIVDIALLWTMWPRLIKRSRYESSKLLLDMTRVFVRSGRRLLQRARLSLNKSATIFDTSELHLCSAIYIRWSTFATLILVSAIGISSVLLVATFPGETLLSVLPILERVPLREQLVAGDIDLASHRRKSIWSNTMIVPGIDVTSHFKADDNEKVQTAGGSVSLRRRNLFGAVLTGARLPKVDFTGADLREAKLDRANLVNARLECGRTIRQHPTPTVPVGGSPNVPDLDFGNYYMRNRDFQALSPSAKDCTRLDHALLDFADLQGAILDYAQMPGASLNYANFSGASLDSTKMHGALLVATNLQGARLSGAQLQGAWLQSTELQGADLSVANMQAATLFMVSLQGASLDVAQLSAADIYQTTFDGASLNYAKLEGSYLFKVTLRGASLNFVDLRGSTLVDGDLRGAVLRPTSVWRATIREANTEQAWIAEPHMQGLCREPTTSVCDWSLEDYRKLQDEIREVAAEALARSPNAVTNELTPLLDPGRTWFDEVRQARNWQKLFSVVRDQREAETQRIRQLFDTACGRNATEPALRGIIRNLQAEINGSFITHTLVSDIAGRLLNPDCTTNRNLPPPVLLKLKNWAAGEIPEQDVPGMRY